MEKHSKVDEEEKGEIELTPEDSTQREEQKSEELSEAEIKIKNLHKKYDELQFYNLIDLFSNETDLKQSDPELVVEKIRILSEFIIFGEKYKAEYFEAFQHQQILSSFQNILA